MKEALSHESSFNNNQELVRVVSKQFNLQHRDGAVPRFEVSNLNFCQGNNVTIDESAYELLLPFLDRVDVVLELKTCQSEAGLGEWIGCNDER